MNDRVDLFRVVLALLFFVTPLLIFPAGFESVMLPKTVWVVLVTGVLAALVLLKREWLPERFEAFRTPLDLPALAVVATAALSIALQGESPAGNRAFRLLISGILLVYLLVYFFRRRPQWVRLCRAGLLGAAAAVAAYVVLQDYGLDPFSWSLGESPPDWRFRLPGTMGNPNAVAGFLAVVLPLLVLQFYTVRSLGRRLLAGFALAVVFMALVVTFSVGAWMGIVFGGLLSLWTLRKSDYAPMSWPLWAGVVVILIGLFLFAETSEHRSLLMAPLRILKSPPAVGLLAAGLLAAAIAGVLLAARRFQLSRAVVAAPLVMLLAAALFYITPHPYNGRPGSILDQAAASNRWRTGAGARRFIWQTTALMVEDRPLRGIGFGRYFKVHALYQGQLYTKRGTPHDRPTVGKVPQAHNEYFQQMAETGLPGTLAFLWLVLAVIALWERAYNRAALSERREVLASITGLGIFMVHALTSFPLRRPSTWLAGAFLLAHVVAKADPLKPAKEPRGAATGISPAFRVALLAALAFQAVWMLRPLMAGLYLKRATESLSAPAERWRHLNRAVAWEPSEFAPHFYSALVLYQAGRYEDAIEEAERALRDHEDLEVRRLISDAYAAQGKALEAARAWDNVLRLNPCYPPFLEEAAERYARAGEPAGAEAYARRARELREKGTEN